MRDDARDVGKGMSGFWHIARERSESEYSWDADGDGKKEAVGIGVKVEWIKSR